MMQLPLFDAVEIRLTQGKFTLVDVSDIDLAEVSWYCKPKSGYDNTEYAVRNTKRTESSDGKQHTIRLHRVIMERLLGRPLLTSEEVDHINRDGLDNRRSNLRLTNHSQNMRNSRLHANSTSGYKGVTFNRRRSQWHSRINVNNRRYHLGFYSTAEEAYAAYCKAAAELHGEFARTE